MKNGYTNLNSNEYPLSYVRRLMFYNKTQRKAPPPHTDSGLHFSPIGLV